MPDVIEGNIVRLKELNGVYRINATVGHKINVERVYLKPIGAIKRWIGNGNQFNTDKTQVTRIVLSQG